tara:strand:+ start:5598 stop:6011 length:414 start_codon:yes stop_codon:yes gene_type:complete
MDLSSLDTATNTAVMEVRHPVTGEPLLTDDDLPISITLLSSDSDEYETAMHDAQRSAARAAAQTDGIADPAGTTRRAIAVLVRCIVGWENIIVDGEDLSYSRSNAGTLLTKVRFIREQVSKFVANRANYLEDSKGES